jgi:hypothetical protein
MRCVGPVMTEGKVCSMRHDWPRYGLVEARLMRCFGPGMTEGKAHLMRHDRSRYDRRKSPLDAARSVPL